MKYGLLYNQPKSAGDVLCGFDMNELKIDRKKTLS